MDKLPCTAKNLGVALGVGLWLLSHAAAGQPAPADTSLLAARHRLRQQYDAAVGNDYSLYNGPEYVEYIRHPTQGHRFFESAEEQMATVEYGGTTYTNVPLRYDLVRGQLVVRDQSGTLQLSLVNERVTRFTLGSHLFERLAGTAESDLPTGPGFYEILVAGPVRVLVAYRKVLQETVSPRGIEGQIFAKNECFVQQQDGRYYRVGNAGSLLSLFPQHKAALRKYIQANELDFASENRSAAIAAVVRYQATLGK